MTIHTVTWTEDMAVGVKVLDDDHKRLIALMNKVIAAFYAGVGGRMVETAMNELDAYTREHFAREEAMLEAKGDTNLDSHRRQHRELVDELTALRAEKPGAEVIAILYRWLVAHIMGTDMGYRPLFR